MTPCGTVGYTAPEIVKDERYSKSVDMWALGCVLYTLLCGFPPFYDESIRTLTEKVARGQYTFLSPWWDNISKSAKDLISHLLTVDPVRRYTIDEFLHHPWIRESGEDTVPAFDAPPTTIDYGKQEFLESMDGVEETDSIPANVRAAMAAGTQPLTPGARAAEFRSPGSVSLREVFDVSYSVHRMEEERARRVKDGGFGGLNALDEDEEEALDPVVEESTTEDGSSIDKSPRISIQKHSVWDHVGEDQLSSVQRDLQKAAISKSQQHHKQHHHRHKQGASSSHTTAPPKRKGGFELNLEGATLLARRGVGSLPPDPATHASDASSERSVSVALKVQS
jgi:serine/threonine-protein kinase RCK2